MVMQWIQQTAAMLPSELQKLDGHQSSDGGQYTRREDPSRDYQKHDLTATTKYTTLIRNFNLLIQRIFSISIK